MADPLRRAENEEDAGIGPDLGAGSHRPRWVVVLWIVIAIAAVGLVVLLHLTGIIGPGAH